ncbi:hypothetical protein ACOZ4I_03730 [Haloarcula salina]|uniref:hypothetical protein n=1 Tax=Haloarcula salina TaxID=1429914 RepID=UPI003C6EBB10
MSWLADNRLLLLFAAVVLTTLGAVGAAIVGVVATLGALLGGGAVVQTFAAFFLGTLLLAGLDVVFSVALVRELARRASLPKSRRAAAFLARAESLIPPLAALGLSERVAPSFEDRHEALTQRYVEGEITEATYERELQALLDDADAETGPLDDVRVDSGRSASAASRNAPQSETEPEREPARE